MSLLYSSPSPLAGRVGVGSISESRFQIQHMLNQPHPTLPWRQGREEVKS